MTKEEYKKYNKEVKDKYHNLLKPGDTVIFPDGYLNDVHIGTISHFTDKNVIILYRHGGFSYHCKAQRHPDRIIKIKDKDGNYSELPEGIKTDVTDK